MKVTLLCVGGVKGPLASVIHEYEDRARRYWRFQALEVPAGHGKRGKAGEREVREAEEARILSQLPAKGKGDVVALTRAGKPMGSRGLAEYLEERAVRSSPQVAFVIGGAFGLGDQVLARADRKLAISSMTLPHEVARLILTEQLYRAGSISRNEPYHKGP